VLSVLQSTMMADTACKMHITFMLILVSLVKALCMYVRAAEKASGSNRCVKTRGQQGRLGPVP